MIIYPYIALKGGRCVNLLRGRIDRPVAYDVDPLEKAHRFAQAGAEWLHVIDIDAIAGTGSNEPLVRSIIRESGTQVQVAGGIRTTDQARFWIDCGAGRVTFATAAAQTPRRVMELSESHPDQIVVSVNVRQGRVLINGWRDETAFGASEFIRQFAGWPISQIIVNDIDRDLDLPESSFALVTRLAAETQTPVIASGLARSLDDIAHLKYLYNISGAIVGRALFEGVFTLEEALEVARARPEPIAKMI